jgi:stage V sporulation protein G
MIISVVGPLAVGKSHFCKWFVERHPEFVHTSIDDARFQAGKEWEKDNNRSIESASELSRFDRLELEDKAWNIVYSSCEDNPYVILETSGLSWRMASILHDPQITEKGIYVVKLIGDRDKCLERLINRQKASTKYFPYEMDERTGLDWMMENMHRVPHNLLIDVDSDEKYDILYKKAEEYILAAKLKLESEALEIDSNKHREEKEDNMTLKVTDVRFFNAKNGKSKIRAYAAVTFNGELIVRGYKIVEGENGLFVGKPSQLSQKDNTWYDNINYANEDLQNQIHAAIMERYTTKSSGSRGKTDDFDQTSESDGVPF